MRSNLRKDVDAGDRDKQHMSIRYEYNSGASRK
jgi:hypothetical protein